MHTIDIPCKKAPYTHPCATFIHLSPAGQLLQASLDLNSDDDLEQMTPVDTDGWIWDGEN